MTTLVSSNNPSYDWLIVGGGIIGLSIARELRNKFPQDTIAVLEKEAHVGVHASGRNSGVLHAGIYYAPGSLKAKLCLEGRTLMSEYCAAHQLPLKKIGKIIIPTHQSEETEIERLYTNARANGVNIELLNGDDIHKLEPEANHQYQKALYSPHTMVVSPKEIMSHLSKDLEQQGVVIKYDSEVKNIDVESRAVICNKSKTSFGFLINAAGAFADKVAHKFGLGLKYSIFPFRGAYYQLNPESSLKIRTNIYPVPDKKVPFLGVHFTPSVEGKVYIGPTAMPALGREHYSGVTGMDFDTISSAIPLLLSTYIANQQGMRTLIHNEMRRLSKDAFVNEAKKLVPKVTSADVISCAKRGIRAQLFDKQKNAIEMDFVVESTANSLHVLNAVSPAFTCGFSFARYLTDQITKVPQKH